MGYQDSFNECDWQEKVAGHGYASVNASRSEVLMGSNFSANFFRQFFGAAFFFAGGVRGHESDFYLLVHKEIRPAEISILFTQTFGVGLLENGRKIHFSG